MVDRSERRKSGGPARQSDSSRVTAHSEVHLDDKRANRTSDFVCRNHVIVKWFERNPFELNLECVQDWRMARPRGRPLTAMVSSRSGRAGARCGGAPGCRARFGCASARLFHRPARCPRTRRLSRPNRTPGGVDQLRATVLAMWHELRALSS